MKNIPFFLFLPLLFLSTPIIAQNLIKNQEEPSSYQEEAYTPVPKGLAKERKFIFSIELRTGGLVSLGPNSPIYTTGLSTLQLGASIPMYKELVLNLRFRAAFPYNQMAGPIGASLPMIYEGSLTAGFSVGLGGRVLDKRSSALGWVGFVSGGFFMDFGLRNFFISDKAFSSTDSLYQMFSIGLELETFFAYYFHPRAAFSLSFHLGFSGSPFAGDPFYSNYNPLQVGFTRLSFGLGIGLIF